MTNRILVSLPLAALSLILATGAANADEFCDGFERGFTLGYMQASGSALEPLTPLCPLQPLKGLNDPDSDYEHGMIIGMQRGYAEGYSN
jgi:hypothetical protein